jgi:hypothetical protein
MTTIEARGDRVIRLSVPGYPGRVTIVPHINVPYVITVSNGAGRTSHLPIAGHPDVVRSVAETILIGEARRAGIEVVPA